MVTQTVAPRNLQVSAVTGTEATVGWTPIQYTGPAFTEGFYSVYYSSSSGVPYTLADKTLDKTSTSFQLRSLSSGTPYSFVVRTTTGPHVENESTVTSEFSNEVTSRADAPRVLSIEPNGGTPEGGTEVRITGERFVAGATIAFDGMPARGTLVHTSGELICETPPGAGTATATVRNADCLAHSL
jgi:hypothetical protein